MSKVNELSNAKQASRGTRAYSTPVMVRYGELASLTAAGSGPSSESAGTPTMCEQQGTFRVNTNCPPGGV